MDISAETLDRLFAYDPDTGVLTHKTRAANHIRIGDVAGSLHLGPRGTMRYIRVVIRRERYMAHRIICKVLGIEVPAGMLIDHIDGNGENNRVSNLRIVSHVGNCQNTHRTRSQNKGKKIGVAQKIRKDGTSTWTARITLPNHAGHGPGKLHTIGTYRTEAEAEGAYRLAKTRFHSVGPIAMENCGELHF